MQLVVKLVSLNPKTGAETFVGERTLDNATKKIQSSVFYEIKHNTVGYHLEYRPVKRGELMLAIAENLLTERTTNEIFVIIEQAFDEATR